MTIENAFREMIKHYATPPVSGEPRAFKVGDRVRTRFGGRWHEHVVHRVERDRVIVDDHEGFIPLAHIELVAPPPRAPGELRVGDLVVGRYTGREWTVAAVNGCCWRAEGEKDWRNTQFYQLVTDTIGGDAAVLATPSSEPPSNLAERKCETCGGVTEPGATGFRYAA